MRMNSLREEKDDRFEEIGEDIGKDLGERERCGERKRPGKRERDICEKSNLEKYRQFFLSSFTLPGKGSDLGKDRRTTWENGKRCFGKTKGRERDLESEGKREKIRESKK